MSNETSIATQETKLPVTRTGGRKLFKRVAKGNNFLPFLQLFSKQKAVSKRLIPPGEYGVVVSDEEVTSYGETIDVMIFAVRAKAVDTSGKKAIINFDDESEIFKTIMEKSFIKQADNKTPYKFGLTFLTWVRGYGFHEYFCRTKTSRAEAAKLEPYMAVSADEVEEAFAEDIELEEQDAQPITLGARFKEADDFSWHIMTVSPCSQPFKDLPPQEEINEAVVKFISQKSSEVELADESSDKDEAGGRVR